MTADLSSRASVVICAHSFERLDSLLRGVDSILLQRQKPLDLVVAVDHNPDLRQLLSTRLDSGVRLVSNDGIRGLSATRNIGVEHAKGEFIAFIDDDAVADADWLSRLVRPFDDPRVVAVGGAIIPAFPGNLRPQWLAEELDWVVGCTYRGLPVGEGQTVRNVIGCNMAFRRTILDSVGGFNHKLGRLGKITGQAEDTEICLRIRRQSPNAVIIFEPAAIVRHEVPPSRLTFRFLLQRSYNEGLYKQQMSRLSDHRHSDGLASETAYLKYLLFRFIPARLIRFLHRTDRHQLYAVFSAIAAVGYGSFVARLQKERRTA